MTNNPILFSPSLSPIPPALSSPLSLVYNFVNLDHLLLLSLSALPKALFSLTVTQISDLAIFLVYFLLAPLSLFNLLTHVLWLS